MTKLNYLFTKNPLSIMTINLKATLVFILSIFFLQSCAILHSTQFGPIDSKIVTQGRKFELLVSETGINLNEAGAISRAFVRNQKTRNTMREIETIISLFQMGPRTGNTILDEKYADVIFDGLKEKCPSGIMSGLMSARETAKYPVVSGEIVRITGYCLDS